MKACDPHIPTDQLRYRLLNIIETQLARRLVVAALDSATRDSSMLPADELWHFPGARVKVWGLLVPEFTMRFFGLAFHEFAAVCCGIAWKLMGVGFRPAQW